MCFLSTTIHSSWCTGSCSGLICQPKQPSQHKGFIYAHILTAQWRGPAAMPFVLVRNFYKSLVLSFLWEKVHKNWYKNRTLTKENVTFLYMVQVGRKKLFQNFKSIFSSYFLNSQIRLNWLRDDCHLTYHPNFEKNKRLQHKYSHASKLESSSFRSSK